MEIESRETKWRLPGCESAIVEEMQKKKAYGLESSSASSASASTSLSSPSPEQELAKLTEKVREVYESVVTTEAKASSIEAVDMLREIEEIESDTLSRLKNAQRRRRRARTQDKKERRHEIPRVEDAATKSRARVAIEENFRESCLACEKKAKWETRHVPLAFTRGEKRNATK